MNGHTAISDKVLKYHMLEKTLPVIAMFAAGALLGRLKILSRETGEGMLRLIFYLAMPCLALDTVPGLTLNRARAVLPLCALVIVTVTGLAAWLASTRWLGLNRRQTGVLVNAAMIMNLSGATLPEVIRGFTGPVGKSTVPLTMITLGILFRPGRGLPPPIIAGILLRSAAGLAVGFVMAGLTGLTGLERTILLAGSAAPAGYNTITFALLAGLDVEMAATLVSISLGLGLLTVPLTLALFGG